MPGDMLLAEGMTGGYGGADILKGVDLAVAAGEIVAIIGPNGAGKSTAMKAVFGLVRLREGEVRFRGEDIGSCQPDELVRKGMAYVPQERSIFPSLTVHENLEMGAFIRRDDFSHVIDQVYTLFPPLKEKRRQQAGELSGGQRQMVAFGRALMTEPSLLLLDEPTAGLSPVYMREIFERVIAVNQTGVGILMVEQNARQALRVAHRGYVLATGENIFTDTGEALLANPEVAESFLGGRNGTRDGGTRDGGGRGGAGA
ncbi:MAG: ABC transporter ATP-binding protein [Rhodospirillaceae bacterium]|nr:ABC transporter ATP-binding protein [Rhodospirillaceae bacterium]